MTVGELAIRLEDLRLRHVPDPRLGVWDVALDEEGDAPGITGAVTEPGAIEDLRALAGEAGVRAALEVLPAAGAELQAIAHRSLAHLRAEPRHSFGMTVPSTVGGVATTTSRTPSSVGTSGRSSPNEARRIAFRGIPRFSSSARTLSARARLARRLTAGPPDRSLCPSMRNRASGFAR